LGSIINKLKQKIMKKVLKLLVLAFFTALTTTFEGCKKDALIPTNAPPALTTSTSSFIPALTTAEVSSITSTSAISGGNITDDGGGDITAKGISWSTTPDWYIYGNDSTIYGNGPGSGSFVSYLSNLKPGTTYYVKAYAVNSSGIAFGSTISFTTPATNPGSFNGSVSDVDGNVYKTVQIGDQLWMAENLKTTKYKDGTSIPNVSENTDWSNLHTDGYSWYDNNDVSYKDTYGALYNWYAVTNSRNICPNGWHVPSADEWTTLATYLGGSGVAGGKMKEAGTDHWLTPNTGANNSSGMTGLPGGVRRDDGLFVNMHFISVWWSTSISNDGGLPVAAYTNADIANFYLPDYLTMNMGCSIRCLKD
jgi:uncharacterized protein (TIGR02145 family)